MTIEMKKTDAETVLKVSGRLDTTTAPVLDKTISEEISANTNLVLDLEELVYISSAGLRILKLAYMAVRKKDGELQLKNVNRLVMEVFEMTGFAGLLTFI